jgi:hypothetical protein
MRDFWWRNAVMAAELKQPPLLAFHISMSSTGPMTRLNSNHFTADFPQGGIGN